MYRLLLLGMLSLVFAGGCASYATPGRGADLSAVGLDEAARRLATDDPLHSALDKKPLARFPTGIAVARIQSPGYCSYTAQAFGRGRYSVLLTRDVEKQEHFDRIAALPMVRGVAPLNRLLLPNELESDMPLRMAAAKLHSDLLLIYTFDTAFYDRELSQPLSTITLGLSPTKNIHVTTTVSGLLMDTRNGYIYGLAEHSVTRNKMATSWNSRDEADSARKKNEEEAFAGFVAAFEKTWSGVISQYAARADAQTDTTR